MNFILVTFGTNEHGLWNSKYYGYKVIADAVTEAETMECDGYVVIATWNEGTDVADQCKVVYEENTEGIVVGLFPFIGVYTKQFAEALS